jgi:hypothetical protein
MNQTGAQVLVANDRLGATVPSVHWPAVPGLTRQAVLDTAVVAARAVAAPDTAAPDTAAAIARVAAT